MKLRRIIAILCAFSLMFCLAACSGDKEDEGNTLTVAYQYGISYAPLMVVMEQKLIEKNYGEEIEIEWLQLSSGAAINEAFAAGDVDVAAMGIAPAITGVMNGIPYKICSNVSAQPHKIMTTSDTIKALADIDEEQIALVNIGSIQHILLAMACEKELGDARALDDNIAAMSHPDGMTSLLSGSVSIHLTTAPYIQQELAAEEKEVSTLYDIADVWAEGNSFIVGLASTQLHDSNPELYNAVCKAFEESMTYINENREEAAALLAKMQGCTTEEMLDWLSDPACIYDSTPKGVMEMADFMAEHSFIANGPSALSDVAYDNVVSMENAS